MMQRGLSAAMARGTLWFGIGMAMAFGASANGQQLLINGAFDVPTGSAAPFHTLANGGASLPGWTVLSPVTRVAGFWEHPCGGQSMHLNAGEAGAMQPGAIEQTVVLASGGRLRLSYWIAGHPYGDPTLKRVRVEVLSGTSSLLDSIVRFDARGLTAYTMGWRQDQFEFSAPPGAVTVRFTSLNQPEVGAALDCVALEALAPVCVADLDDGTGTGSPDGGVGIEDLLYYIQIFESGVAAADLDDGTGGGVRDGGVTIEDLLYFGQRFEAGC